MNYMIVIEGQHIPVPEEIGASDAAVKAALTPTWPDAANAMITRVTKDDLVTVTVVKKAGTKGARRGKKGERRLPLQYLVSCKGGMNPAIALYQELQGRDGGLSPEETLELGDQVEGAIEAGQKQYQKVREARERLEKAQAVAAPGLAAGF